MMKTLSPVELSGNTLKPPKAWYHRNAKKLSDLTTFVLGGKAHNVISFFLLLLIFFLWEVWKIHPFLLYITIISMNVLENWGNIVLHK